MAITTKNRIFHFAYIEDYKLIQNRVTQISNFIHCFFVFKMINDYIEINVID